MTDTPDWQSGVYSPQSLLAHVTVPATTLDVTLPPNTETMIICLPGGGSAPLSPTVQGDTTTKHYPVFNYASSGGDTSVWWIVPVFPAADETVKITWPGGAESGYYVISDAEERVLIDSTLQSLITTINGPIGTTGLTVYGNSSGNAEPLQVDSSGHLIPLVPTLTYTTNAPGNGTIIAAPGSGALYLFDADLGFPGTGSNYVGILSAGTLCGQVAVNAVNAGADHCKFSGYRTTSAIALSVGNNTGDFTLRYALGP